MQRYRGETHHMSTTTQVPVEPLPDGLIATDELQAQAQALDIPVEPLTGEEYVHAFLVSQRNYLYWWEGWSDIEKANPLHKIHQQVPSLP